jgi:hypothetical protein
MKESAVWLYDPGANRWANMRPAPYGEPGARDGIGGLCPGATFAEGLDLSISFGGTGSSGAKNNLHLYDAWTNSLTLRKPANAPEVRDGMGIAWDPRNEVLVLFGSQYLSDEKTWTYRFGPNAWESHALEPHPPGKKMGTYSTIPKMAYDSANGVFLLVAWLGEKDGHETWVLDAGKLQWTRMDPKTSPSPSKSRSRNLSYSREYNVFILETMSVQGGPEIWTYRVRGAPSASARLSGLTVATESSQARLSWTQKEPSRVEVERALPADPWALEWKPLGASETGSFVDPGLRPGTAYHYRVRSGPTVLRARAQPRVPDAPVVSVLAADRIEVRWKPLLEKDIAGYHLYRGTAVVKTVTKGISQPWKDNDPEYPEPQVVRVADVVGLEKVTDQLLTVPSFEDHVDLSKKGPESGDYRWSVRAYVLRAVNRLGVESGASPFALSLPSEPGGLLCREMGTSAQLRWDGSPEKGLQGYHVYKLEGGVFGIKRLTDRPLPGTSYTHEAGKNETRYWVTAVDALGQEGQPSSPAWFGRSYRGFLEGEWHP